jgi:aryl-phospho-beta-D-glucosidase BglC (GH1 family)
MNDLRRILTRSNHGIKIIIDLHAAPGSQNGQEHSSSRDGVADWAVQGGTDYLYESIMTIDFLAGR